MAAAKVYLNGEFLPLTEAKVPVMDRGFLFGDAVYEVIPCYGGRPFRLDQHLQRLAGSLQGIGMKPPLSFGQWHHIIDQLTRQLGKDDQSIYLQITRGSSGRREHQIPVGIEPTVFAMTEPVSYPDPGSRAQGIAATTHDDLRWHRCDIKATTLLANILLRQEARNQGAAEVILVRNGEATEGAASNLFMVSRGIIITPPESTHLLPGVTRNLVLELAQKWQLPFEERTIPLADLQAADEIWITSSSQEVAAVVRLDGKPVGNGAPGPIYLQISRYYADYKSLLQRGAAE